MTQPSKLMRKIVVHTPGGPEVLTVEQGPVPTVRQGWVLVQIHAFGLNRAELITRAGGSGDAVKFPRVIGIECVGEVADPSDSGLSRGQTVIAAMGGMGRDFDGGYEEFALLPTGSVIPVHTNLSWADLGAIPETFGTAWGSLDTLDLQAGQTLLVRGATSSVGMAAITLAKARGVSVIATTRQEAKRAALEANGADHVLIDDGRIAAHARQIAPTGVDALFELVGPAVVVDSLAALRPGARACMAGYLGDNWDGGIASTEARRLGVELAVFGSNVINAASYGQVFQSIIDGVEAGAYRLNLDRTFPLDQIADAHRYMASNQACGKIVCVTT